MLFKGTETASLVKRHAWRHAYHWDASLRCATRLETNLPRREPSVSRLDAIATGLLRRRVSHLTPRYLLDRTVLLGHEIRSPQLPWLTIQAVRILATALRRQDRGLEWGSGRSTSWLAQRTCSLVSVESSFEWYQHVGAVLRGQGLANVDYRFIPASETRRMPPSTQDLAYAEIASEFTSESLDYVLIDGIRRDECALRSVGLVKMGGILILDNAERYLPFPSRSPERLLTDPQPAWREFLQRVAGWRMIWTSNGVTDTALWFRSL
jgi:hypothetical protein